MSGSWTPAGYAGAMTGVSSMDQSRPEVPTSYRRPQQSRSRVTVDRILGAADAEIGEVGLHAASTTSIAKRAGLSVGALYRFFKDKEEIAEALIAQYLEEAWPRHEALGRGVVVDEGIAGPVRAFILLAASEQARHPGFYRLAEDAALDRLRGPATQVTTQLSELFADVLQRLGVRAEEDELLAVVELCSDTVRHALVRSAGHPEQRVRVVEELQVMVPAYLAARFASA